MNLKRERDELSNFTPHKIPNIRQPLDTIALYSVWPPRPGWVDPQRFPYAFNREVELTRFAQEHGLLFVLTTRQGATQFVEQCRKDNLDAFEVVVVDPHDEYGKWVFSVLSGVHRDLWLGGWGWYYDTMIWDWKEGTLQWVDTYDLE